MVYCSKLVAVIKVDGKVLREDKGTVTIPFGSEYSVLLKNLNSVRAMAKVSVDGQDATEGTWLVIPANGNLELERFIKSGNLKNGNRFKFIERTKQIEDHKGIGAEDGLVRVEFKPERKVEEVPIHRYHYVDHWSDYWYPSYKYYWGGSTGVFGSGVGLNSTNTSGGQHVNCSVRASRNSSGSKGWATQDWAGDDRTSHSMTDGLKASLEEERSANDQGITVAGSESQQQFYSVPSFETEASDVIVIKLRGMLSGQPVAQPVTVQLKPECRTCGKRNKATSKFCNQCGTALVLI